MIHWSQILLLYIGKARLMTEEECFFLILLIAELPKRALSRENTKKTICSELNISQN
jgi:hypothetical protein